MQLIEKNINAGRFSQSVVSLHLYKKSGNVGPAIAGHESEPARHEITISENVSRKLELAYLSESLRIGGDD